jgi:flavin reductase (DIM6/NTAB) family NADH-FMN oxidoreductase RutF
MDATPADLPIDIRYKLLTGLVVPRPIAWVSSLSPNGEVNLAPFSYFSIIGHAPMALSFSVAGRKPDRSDKDTLRNVRRPEEGGTGQFVINIVSEAQAAAMARTAATIGFGQSEFDLAGLVQTASTVVTPPRVSGSPAAFECRTLQIVEVGVGRIVIGEVVHIHVDDAVLDQRSRVRFDKLAAVGRMAGATYVRTADIFDLADEGYFPSTPGIAVAS